MSSKLTELDFEPVPVGVLVETAGEIVVGSMVQVTILASLHDHIYGQLYPHSFLRLMTDLFPVGTAEEVVL